MEELKQGLYSGNVILNRGNDGMLACVTSYEADHFNNAPHYHDNTHFSFTLEGGCVEKKKDAYEITPGNITYYSAGEQHQVLKIAGSTRRINLEIEQSFFQHYHISDGEVRSAVTRNPDAKFLMVKMYRELLANDCLSELSIQMLLLQLVNQTKKLCGENMTPGWVTTVQSYLQDNPDEHITLTELSALTGLHPVTLSKQFPRYFSCTIGEYKRKLKIEKALSLIKSSGLSLTAIALACGFFDQNHFIRTFKQLTGFLPFGYRKS